MRWLAALALFAAGSTAFAAEPPLIPTIPQIPRPVVHQEGGTIVQVGGLGDPVPPPVAAAPAAVTQAVPCDTGAEPVGPAAQRGHGAPTSICPGSPIKQWLCFRPTTAHALPWLRPAPYVGPITGQFHCTSNSGPGCAGDAGCGADHGGLPRGGARPRGRGCNGDGTCVTPDEGEFGGYRFASPLSTRPGAPGATAASISTSYRPAVPPTGMTAAPAAGRTPTVLDSLRRNLGWK